MIWCVQVRVPVEAGCDGAARRQPARAARPQSGSGGTIRGRQVYHCQPDSTVLRPAGVQFPADFCILSFCHTAGLALRHKCVCCHGCSLSSSASPIAAHALGPSAAVSLSGCPDLGAERGRIPGRLPAAGHPARVPAQAGVHRQPGARAVRGEHPVQHRVWGAPALWRAQNYMRCPTSSSTALTAHLLSVTV